MCGFSMIPGKNRERSDRLDRPIQSRQCDASRGRFRDETAVARMLPPCGDGQVSEADYGNLAALYAHVEAEHSG